MTRVEIWMGGMTFPNAVIDEPQEVRMMDGGTVLIVAEDGTRFETAPQNVLLVIGKKKD